MTFDQIIDAECRAEEKIRAVLIDLSNETGLSVDWVKVDTRNFANYVTEVSLKVRPASEAHKEGRE